MRFFFLILLFTFMATANMEIYPKKECELFNNLKHTKNRGHEMLRLDQPYVMLKHHKGQYLVKVADATPPQRWVDDDCLSLRPLRGTAIYEKMQSTPAKTTVKNTVSIEDELATADKHMAQKSQTNAVTSKQNLLALSWHNAFCETHRYKKECKRGLGDLLKKKKSDTQFVLHGLWPQPRNNIYCDVDSALITADKRKRWKDLPCLALNDEVEEKLEKTMPGFASDLHKHEWVKHGTCYGTDANRYFSDAITLVHQVNEGVLGRFFTQNIGKKVTLKGLQTIANKAYGRGAGEKISLQCKNGMVTELWLQLGSGSTDLSTLLKKGKKSYSRCKGGFVDKAEFRR